MTFSPVFLRCHSAIAAVMVKNSRPSGVDVSTFRSNTKKFPPCAWIASTFASIDRTSRPSRSMSWTTSTSARPLMMWSSARCSPGRSSRPPERRSLSDATRRQRLRLHQSRSSESWRGIDLSWERFHVETRAKQIARSSAGRRFRVSVCDPLDLMNEWPAVDRYYPRIVQSRPPLQTSAERPLLHRGVNCSEGSINAKRDRAWRPDRVSKRLPAAVALDATACEKNHLPQR